MAHSEAAFELSLEQALQLLVRADTTFMWELAVLLANELRLLLRFNTGTAAEISVSWIGSGRIGSDQSRAAQRGAVESRSDQSRAA